MDTIVAFIIMGLFSIAGFYLLQGKAAFMIAGYNMFSKSEKEKYDEPALCKFVGKLMFVIVFALGLLTLSEAFDSTWLLIASFVLIIVTSIFGIIYMNTKKRFKKESPNRADKYKKSNYL